MSTTAPLSAQLAFLLGDFEGSSHVHPSQWAPEGVGRARVRAALHVDGLVLVQEEEVTGEDVQPFTSVTVFMADPSTGQVLLYPFDSIGFPPESPARGGWRDGELVLERESPRGRARSTYRPTATGYQWRKTFRASPEQPWSTVVDGELRRVPESGRS